jgi:hypothetical protein
MLGFHVSVYRQQEDAATPPTFETHEGLRLAVWQTDYSGLSWLNDLVNAGEAIHLGGMGYPFRYAARAEHLLPRLTIGPPRARDVWLLQPGDTVTHEWEGRTVIDQAGIGECRPDEWLLIEAWDES